MIARDAQIKPKNEGKGKKIYDQRGKNSVMNCK
jgi:hypothetical protein